MLFCYVYQRTVMESDGLDGMVDYLGDGPLTGLVITI